MPIGLWLHSLAVRLGGCVNPPSPGPVIDEFMPVEMRSDFPVYDLPWAEIRKSFDALGLAPMDTKLPDASFYTTDEEHWRQFIKHLTYPSLYFKERERKDCDDYSKKASADSGFYFGLNCLQVWGHTPIGLHAFNMVMVSKSGLPSIASAAAWRVFEPDAGKKCAGKLLDLDNEFGWKPESWKS